MTDTPDISEAEWEVMQVLWDAPGLTANDVVDRVAGRRGWNPRTVKTLLNRLLTKRALRFEAEGNRYRYFPAVSREACVRTESRSFLSRVFDGAAAPAVLHLLSQCDVDEFRKLSPEEVRHLRQLLDEAGNEGRRQDTGDRKQ